MFNSLTGRITGRGPNLLYLATGGVEWELEVSGFTLRALAREDPGSEVRVFTHLYHREDQMRLYGFASADERRVFTELIRVSGIGPRAAIKMLSGTSPSEIIRLLEAEDVDGLVRLPGLGKKTAQKVILTLRGTLVAPEGEAGPGHAEIIEGLVEMGFDRSRVVAVVGELAAAAGDQSATEQADEAAGAPRAAPASVDVSDREKEIFRRAIVRLAGE